jgi:hypothetical protein
MANSLITAQWVARKALVLLHAKSNFTGRTNRDYQSLLPGPINGVILGQQLSIRLPFQYTLRTGPQMNAQNSVQRFATLLVNQQLGVDINFTSVERAMLLNNFEEQVLEPAMARLAAGIENFTTGQVNNVPKFTGAFNTTATYDQLLQNEQYLTEALAPEDDRRWIRGRSAAEQGPAGKCRAATCGGIPCAVFQHGSREAGGGTKSGLHLRFQSHRFHGASPLRKPERR